MPNANLKGESPSTQAELLNECREFLADSVQYEQADYDHPPEPASQWDYDAGQLAYRISVALSERDSLREINAELVEALTKAVNHLENIMWNRLEWNESTIGDALREYDDVIKRARGADE